MRTLFVHIFILSLSLGLAQLSFGKMTKAYELRAKDNEADLETLYLPQAKVLKAISFGYQNVTANYLWFKTISYFGKHYHTDQQYRWLDHMCNLVIDLNPGEKQVYEFCSLMLAWEAGQIDSSIAILSRAIENHPQSWRFRYLRGFNYMFFAKDEHKAQSDFIASAKLPEADPFVVKLASKKLAINQSPESAAEFLTELLKHSHDPSERAALEDRLKEARYEIDLQTLEKAIAYFTQKQGHAPQTLEDLISTGIINSKLIDPYGGKYYLDPKDSKVKSTTSMRRLTSQRKK